MKIYIVEESRGQWSGAYSDTLKAFFDQKNADEFIEEHEQKRDKIKDSDDYRRWQYLRKIVWECDESDFEKEHGRPPSEEEEKDMENEMNQFHHLYHEFDEHNEFYIQEIEVPDFKQFLRENKLSELDSEQN